MIWLVFAAAVVALCGYAASTAARRRKRRARIPFLVGFCCGLAAGTLVRQRRTHIGRILYRTAGAVDIAHWRTARPSVGGAGRLLQAIKP